MEKEYSQLELFSQAKGYNQAKLAASKAFISYISKYEKALLIIIAFLITGIASFSLGVKKGKSYILLKTGSRMDIAAKPETPLPAPVPKAQTRDQQQFQPEPVKKDEPIRHIQNYTIQVASFLNKTNAQKEADNLKRRGMSALVLSKGRFSIVCVGNFVKREEAQLLLSKLKKQYQDCHIRRL